MPAFIAFITGEVKVLALITVVAMPAAFAAVAVVIATAIWAAFDVCDPVHLGLGRPSSAAASAIPNWVGTKNRLVVTWLTNQNCQGGVLGKLPIALFAGVVPAEDEELHAASSAEAAAVALTSPVPFSSRRRVGPSFMLSVSIASSTLGWTASIPGLHFAGVGPDYSWPTDFLTHAAVLGSAGAACR